MGRRAFRRNDVIDQQSRPQTEPIPAATRKLHLDNAASGATFTRTVQPSPGQDKGGYVNYLEANQPASRYFGANLARLTAVRQKYDPGRIMFPGLNGIVKLFENACGAVDVSGFGGGM